MRIILDTQSGPRTKSDKFVDKVCSLIIFLIMSLIVFCTVIAVFRDETDVNRTFIENNNCKMFKDTANEVKHRYICADKKIYFSDFPIN